MAKEEQIEITKLEFPDCVRKRSGMYIGSTDNPDVILREIVDNAVDEVFLSKSGNTIHKHEFNDFYIVTDNGRGIPITLKDGITQTEMAVGSLHAGGKFNKTIDSASAGLNGVGSSVCNALSSQFIVCSKITESNHKNSIKECKDKIGDYYYIMFEKGIKKAEGVMKASMMNKKFNVDTKYVSTLVAFKPDPKIFKSTKASYSEKSLKYIKVVGDKFYNKNVKLIFDNKEIENDFKPYKFELFKKIKVDNEKQADFYVTFETCANLQDKLYEGALLALSCNQGLHIQAVNEAYSKALKDAFGIEHDCLLEGLKITSIIKCGEVDYSSQTKERVVKLSGLSKNDISSRLINEFKKIFEENKEEFAIHVQRLNDYAESLDKISALQKLKGMIATGDDGKLRSKLDKNIKDCSSKNRKDCELFIVEGASASGTAVKIRDRNTQAIIELKGVIMNVSNLEDMDKLLKNKEVKNIITAIGCGIDGARQGEPRYGKILLTADADADGLHINSLLLALFAKKMRFLIEEGYIYITLGPLYQQNGKYFYPMDEEKPDFSKPLTRFKGWGECSEKVIRECILNKDTRRLIKITPENIDEALKIVSSTQGKLDLLTSEGVISDPYKCKE